LNPSIVGLPEGGIAASGIACCAYSIASIVEVNASSDREGVGVNQRDIGAGTASHCDRVGHREFKECAIFAIEAAGARLKVGNCRRELARTRVARGSEDVATFD